VLLKLIDGLDSVVSIASRYKLDGPGGVWHWLLAPI